MVRFTPNGWSVISRQRLTSLRRSSGVGCVRPVRMPKPPALETAEASSARPTHCMPPCTIGCLMPNISVKRVLIMGASPACLCWPPALANLKQAGHPAAGFRTAGRSTRVYVGQHVLPGRCPRLQEIGEGTDDDEVIE